MGQEKKPWTKGGPSPNPGGRSKGQKQLIKLAREHTTEALQAIVRVLLADGTSDRDRLAAARLVLERGWGKPHQSTEITATVTDLREVSTEDLVRIARGE